MAQSKFTYYLQLFILPGIKDVNVKKNQKVSETLGAKIFFFIMISFSTAQTEKSSWKKSVKQFGENI